MKIREDLKPIVEAPISKDELAAILERENPLGFSMTDRWPLKIETMEDLAAAEIEALKYIHKKRAMRVLARQIEEETGSLIEAIRESGLPWGEDFR